MKYTTISGSKSKNVCNILQIMCIVGAYIPYGSFARMFFGILFIELLGPAVYHDISCIFRYWYCSTCTQTLFKASLFTMLLNACIQASEH